MGEELSCDICGDKSYTVLFPANVAQINQIVKCNTCGLMYANPRKEPESDFIEQHDPDQARFLGWPETQRRIEKERLQVRDYESARTFLKRYFPHAGNLVEMGSGFGFLCNFFKESGWTVMGVEPHKALCRYAKSAFRLNTIPSAFEKTNIPDNSADVVLMIHVIEHVGSPQKCLSQIYKILKPGGFLILETPRYDTWMFKLLGKRERSLASNGHIYFFTNASLEKLTRQVGFKLIKRDYVGRSLTLDRFIYNLGIMLKNKALASSLSKGSRLLRLQALRFSLNLRDMQRLYLRK